MARKLEFGAGIAAAVLAIFGLVALLLAPFPFCTVPSVTSCPSGHIHSVRLINVQLDAAVWIYIIGMAVFLLAAAAGAIADARSSWRWGVLLLWVGAILAFAGCGVGAGGALGLIYLPGVLATLLAGYGSLLRRLRRRPPTLS